MLHINVYACTWVSQRPSTRSHINLRHSYKKASWYDLEIPHSHIADQPTAPWGRPQNTNSLFCLFVWFDSLSPINNLSVIKGRVFLSWTSTKLGLMSYAQGHNQWRRWKHQQSQDIRKTIKSKETSFLFPIKMPARLEGHTVSHYSYAPLFQGPHFWTKMLELNIRYDNLFIDILSVWWHLKKYWNHSCESFCYVKGNFPIFTKMHVQPERLYFLFLFWARHYPWW